MVARMGFWRVPEFPPQHHERGSEIGVLTADEAQ
jgi:hypothetical protein